MQMMEKNTIMIPKPFKKMNQDVNMTRTITRELSKDIDSQMINIKENQQKIQDRIHEVTENYFHNN